jgi:hypothetical protein
MDIEAYLNQLCDCLSVDPLRRDEIRLETHIHLRERTEELISQGMDRSTAEDQAVMEFGDPSEMAARLNGSRPFSLPTHIKNPIRNAAILLFALGFEQSPGLLLSASTLVSHPHPFAFERSGLPILLVVFPMIAGIGLLRGRLWARWAGVLASATYTALILSMLPQRFALRGGSLEWQLLTMYLPKIMLWLYVLWTLLHPRNWKLIRA